MDILSAADTLITARMRVKNASTLTLAEGKVKRFSDISAANWLHLYHVWTAAFWVIQT
jgi:hypothetical protein